MRTFSASRADVHTSSEWNLPVVSVVVSYSYQGVQLGRTKATECAKSKNFFHVRAARRKAIRRAKSYLKEPTQLTGQFTGHPPHAVQLLWYAGYNNYIVLTIQTLPDIWIIHPNTEALPTNWICVVAPRTDTPYNPFM